MEKRQKWGLDCPYYPLYFDSLEELIDDVVQSGMDPNYGVTQNGVPTGQVLVDLIIM